MKKVGHTPYWGEVAAEPGEDFVGSRRDSSAILKAVKYFDDGTLDSSKMRRTGAMVPEASALIVQIVWNATVKAKLRSTM